MVVLEDGQGLFLEEMIEVIGHEGGEGFAGEGLDGSRNGHGRSQSRSYLEAAAKLAPSAVSRRAIVAKAKPSMALPMSPMKIDPVRFQGRKPAAAPAREAARTAAATSPCLQASSAIVAPQTMASIEAMPFKPS